jgi:hypothetical protein
MTGSSKTQYRANQALPPTIWSELPTRAELNEKSQEREPRVQAKRYSSTLPRSTAHGNKSAVNDRRSGIFELPVKSERQMEVRREGRRISKQPPIPEPSYQSPDSSRSSAMTPKSSAETYQDSSIIREGFRARRRARFDMESEPQDPVAQNRAFELPALTQQYPSSQKTVRVRGPLSDLEHRLDPRHLRPTYHGYASEEDVSQFESSVVDY